LVIVLVAINPARQTQQARNTQRRADVLTVLNAVNQYFVDIGSMPAGGFPTCPTTGVVGTSEEDLAADLVTTYIAALPEDPSVGNLPTDSGYTICEGTDDRVTVYAPESLNDGESSTISATR
jgi:type IV pilus assembly protein PilA